MKKLLCLLLALIPIVGFATTVTASVNRNTLDMADRLEYSLQIKSESRIDISEPAPPQIENFSFVNMRSKTSSSTVIRNFKSQSEHIITYIYYYIPQGPGSSKIPAQDIRVGTKVYTTHEIELIVVDSGSGARGQNAPGISPGFDFDDPDLAWSANRLAGETVILAYPPRQQVYRGQPAIISYYLYTDQMVRSFNLEDEQDFPGYGKSIYDQPNTLNYETVTYQGKRFQRALVKRLMLLPNATGEMQAPILSGRARIYEFGYLNQRVRSEAAWLEVLPLPQVNVPPSFTGAVGTFEVSDDLSADKVSLGEAITYSLRISGTGNFNQFTHPDMPVTQAQMTAPMAIDRLNAGVEGSRTLHYTIIPSERGSFILPSLSFSWFDPSTGRYQTFHSQEREIEVKSANVISYFSGLLETGNPQSLRPMLSRNSYPQQSNFLRSFWYWLAVALIFASTGFSAYLAWLKHKARNNPEDYARIMADKALKKYLSEASEAVKSLSEDFYSLAENGLLKYLSDKYGISSRLSVAEKLDKLEDKNLAKTTLEETRAFIGICEEQRFSPQKRGADKILEDYQRLRRIVNLYSKKGVKR